MRFPEHEKVAKIADHSQAIGEFLDWAITVHHVSLPTSSGKLMRQYFEIDERALEEEKRLMLRSLRRVHGFDEEETG